MLSLAANAAEKVVVMTSYPQEMISRFEAAFEAQFPQYRLEVLWKPSHDALAYLKQHRGEVDVYWTPSRNNFSTLASEGLLQKLDADWITAPATLHGTPLNDPQGNYAATEIAGLGIVVNPAAFGKQSLALPRDWPDLTQPALQGKVAFPLPSKVGFAAGLIEAILRERSWQDGWALLTRLSLNAQWVDNGAMFITDEVIAGRAMAGITMDFFAASAIAKGAALTYLYPPVVAYSPAHVAILQASPHDDAARAFTRFTLSPAGQQLLFAADIRKLPVDPKAYQHMPSGYFNPYQAGSDSTSKPRDSIEQAILNTFFEATLVKHQAVLQQLFVNHRFAMHLQRDPATLAGIQQQLLQPLLTEQQLLSAETYQLFKQRQADAVAKQQVTALETQWADNAKAHYQAMSARLQAVLQPAP